MSKHDVFTIKMMFRLSLIFGIIFQIQGHDPITLAGIGHNDSQGRVEIEHNGVVGTVCNDHFNDSAATVVCRQLGFRYGGIAINDTRFGEGTGPIWLDDVKCQGNERTIEDCSQRPWNTSNCNHTEDVGVICRTTPV